MRKTGTSVKLVCAALVVGAAARARADTVWIEAEAAVVPSEGTLTPPLQIRDRDDASGGSFIEVATGSNSTGTPPVNGVATYRVFIHNPGSYRVWGRVIAPDSASDSFWIRANGGSWLKWNAMSLGDTWHWAPVKVDGKPAAFTLDGGAYNVVQIAYREDGTKLDTLVLSDDSGFDPRVAPAGPPHASPTTRLTRGRGAMRVNWTAVAGARSYTIRRQTPGETSFTTIASGVTGFTLTDAGLPRSSEGTCYQIIAVDAAGVSGYPRVDCQITSAVFEDWSPLHFGITAPMLLTRAGNLAARKGLGAIDEPATAGRGVLHFQTPVSTQVKIWASVVAPNQNSDSFWIRMDGAYWIRWNEITPSSCRGYAVVRDANHGKTPVIFPLGPGTHRLEIAYREPGAELARIVIQDDLEHMPSCQE